MSDHFTINGISSAAEQYQAILAERRAMRSVELEEFRRKNTRLKAYQGPPDPEDASDTATGENAGQNPEEQPPSESEPDSTKYFA